MDALTPARLAARLRRHREPASITDPRPDGRLLWVHAHSKIDAAALGSLVRRLNDPLGPIHLMLTGAPPTGDLAQSGAASHRQVPTPTDEAVEQSRFLAHWRPDASVWIGAAERPLLIDATDRAGVPLYLVNAHAPPGATGRTRRIQRLTLARFRTVLAVDTIAAEHLRAVGVGAPRVIATGPLVHLPEPPHSAESDREDFIEAVGARPIWLAAAPANDELDTVLAAHRAALHTAHRLLLLLLPRDPGQSDDLAQELRDGGWTIARRMTDDFPEDATEIFLADTPDELGLWYRLAPVCYLGGSLIGAEPLDPIHPAKLGSALIVGPHGGSAASLLDRLERASAIRRLPNGNALAAAVTDLLSPDRAATLAHAGWGAVTDGAEVAEILADLLVAAIRERG